jgi:methenyltetrahydrofolate cyclohydrolase
MPKLTELPVNELLESFGAPTATPGGGSASALAGAVGVSLLVMVASMPKTRNGTDADRAALDGVLRPLRHNRDRLAELVDRDSEAYDLVMHAYRLPKSSDEEKNARSDAIQAALRGATEVPLDVMRACHAASREGLAVARAGNPSAASDVRVSYELLSAALAGAAANARTNLSSVHDTGFTTGAEAEVQRLVTAMETTAREARQALDG